MCDHKFKVGDEVLVTMSGTIEELPTEEDQNLYVVRFYGHPNQTYGRLFASEDEIQSLKD